MCIRDRRTGKVLGSAILDDYARSLEEISRTGFVAYWTREFRPYLHGAAVQFAPGHGTLTEKLWHKRFRGPTGDVYKRQVLLASSPTGSCCCSGSDCGQKRRANDSLTMTALLSPAMNVRPRRRGIFMVRKNSGSTLSLRAQTCLLYTSRCV